MTNQPGVVQKILQSPGKVDGAHGQRSPHWGGGDGKWMTEPTYESFQPPLRAKTLLCCPRIKALFCPSSTSRCSVPPHNRGHRGSATSFTTRRRGNRFKQSFLRAPPPAPRSGSTAAGPAPGREQQRRGPSRPAAAAEGRAERCRWCSCRSSAAMRRSGRLGGRPAGGSTGALCICE